MSKGYTNTVKKIAEIAGKRKIILWGMDAVSKCVYQDFIYNGVDIKYFVSDERKGETLYKNKEIRDSIDLFLENKDQIYIVVFVLKNHGIIYQKLVDMGFRYQLDFCICGIGGYFDDFDVIDFMLGGYNRYYDKCLGFKIYGCTNNTKTFKILALGGSTTDASTGNNKCWPEYLYEKVSILSKNVTIINGGMGGYATQQELLKLIRDGLYFEPDLVITFDGYNNVSNLSITENFPYIHPYAKKLYNHIEKKENFAPDTLGLRNASKIVLGLEQKTKEDYECWTEAIKNIYGICLAHNIEYMGFLQPMLGVSKTIISKELNELIDAVKQEMPKWTEVLSRVSVFHDKVTPFILQNDYMYDLSDIFDKKSDMFYDTCHATDEGNEVIAEAIYHHICSKSDIKEKIIKSDNF